MTVACGLRSGILTAIQIPDYVGLLSLSVDGEPDINTLGAIVSVRAAENVLVQIQNTFGSGIVITPFGDRPGSLEVTVLNGRACDGTGEPADLSAFNYYRQHRFHGGRPPIISLGPDIRMRGFLYGCSLGATSEQPLPSVVLTFTAWPED